MFSPTAILADALICSLIGAAIGSSKGRGGDAALLGMFLGPLGLLLGFLLKPSIEFEAQRAEAVEAERRKLRGETAPVDGPDAAPPTA